MLFLWFYHACRRGFPRFMMVTDHMNSLTFEDPASVNLVRRALKLAQAGDLYGAAETANVDVGHAQVVSEGLRRGMRYSIGAEAVSYTHLTMNGTAYYAYADALLLALDATLQIEGRVANSGQSDPVTIVYKRTIRRCV